VAAVQIHRHQPDEAAQLVEDLGDVYAAARAEPPYQDDPRWNRDAFVERTTAQVRRPGFVLVTAHHDGELVGFAFGQPIPPGRWYEGDRPPPDHIRDASKFSITELDVVPAWRRQGIGRALVDELLAGRPERYAMLSTLPGLPAHRMYERWGWTVVTGTLPDSGLPPWNTLVLPLHD
jgi:GNAT superfamily N-acetyltransferase